jgi:hypothetical protein
MIFIKFIFTPLQAKPSPSKPDLHWQENDPDVSVHVAFESQGAFTAHSLVSEKY